MLRRTIPVLALLFFAFTAQAADKPLKVFLLVGQSNMQGHAATRTLEHIGMDPATRPMLDAIQTSDGTAKVHEKVWITYLSAGGEKKGQLTTGYGANNDKIGPELTFGIYMQQMLGEPILIIKTAWGGKSIHTDFRPPSAGPYKFNESQLANFEKQNKDLAEIQKAKEAATGFYYRQMLEHVQKTLKDIESVYPDYDANQGYELSGFVWFQGWNDMVDRGVYPKRDQSGGYDAYSEVLGHFIRDVRKDLNAPKLPFVIGVMGAGGPVAKYLPDQKRYSGIHQNFRDAMAAPAKSSEFKGNVAAVLTENYWDMELTVLRDRENKLKQVAKKMASEGEIAKSEERAQVAAAREKEFTARELKVLQTAVSNAEYHYLGCGKIMAGIGKGFAEAMHKLMQ
ncbi:MAG: sialate O-acetylesterase [Planctomycetota bacterium]